MISVSGLELPYSDTKIGYIRLMEYQKEVLNKKEKVITINAPTGSGKTLAILKKALDSTDFGKSALFLYPTNELLNDQLHSFNKLLDVMGYGYSVIEFDGRWCEDGSEIKVLPVNGEHLELLSRDKAKGSVLREILNSPEVADSKLLILSNIDFIYNIVRSRYHLSELLFQDFFKSLSFIAVDELHMYWGTMFLSLLFSLKTLEDKVSHILLSTATHTRNLKVLLESLKSRSSFVNALEGKGRVVRHETNLNIISLGDVNYLSSDKHAEEVLSIVLGLGESENLLCIFNSVMFAEKFANLIENKLGEEVGRIHGFIPKESRKEMRKRRIKVGTSSVEVGVDFDIDALIFEANTATSFIQRFGRVGRHKDGVAVAITPLFESKKIKEKLGKRVQYRELERIVWNFMEVPEDFSRIKNTRTGIKMYLAYTASLIYLLKRVYGAKNPEVPKIIEVKKRLEKVAFSSNLNPGYDRGAIENEIEESKRRISWARNMVYLSKIFPRGGLPTVPAYFEKYRTFEIISLSYLEKADVVLRDSKSFTNKPSWLISLEKSTEFVPVFVIKGINFNNHMKINLIGSFPTNKPDFLRKDSFSVKSEWDSEVNGFIEDLLRELPAYFTFERPEWRFSFFRARKGNKDGYLLIGGDALIWSERGST